MLPFGTPEKVDQSVKEIMEVMNKNGGYIFAAAHNIQEDVPPENIVAMFKAARKYGKSKKKTLSKVISKIRSENVNSLSVGF